MVHECIFRYFHADGHKCSKHTENNEMYCKKHKGKMNYIFEIMENCHIHNSLDTYFVIQYIYDNDTYDMKCPDVINNNSDYKKWLFYMIIAYLLSKSTILKLLTAFLPHQIELISKLKKKNMIAIFHDILYNTYNIAKEDNIGNVIKIQKWIRRCLYQKIIKYNDCISENVEDPFSYDSIEEIPKEYKFSYKDHKDHIYIFNAIELEYFIRNHGAWNPYTKDIIPDHVIKRLHILIKYNRLSYKYHEEFKWQTSRHAYTDLSQIMEKAGFYTDVEWFHKLNFKTCKNVISVYRDLCVELSNAYFARGFEMQKNEFFFDFCKEAIQLFKDADEHYILCCNFMKALAINSDDFYSNLPSWLLNIESPLPFLHTTNARNSTLLYMYVQNLIYDNFEEAEDQHAITQRMSFLF
jgi:hypothetical protein